MADGPLAFTARRRADAIDVGSPEQRGRRVHSNSLSRRMGEVRVHCSGPWTVDQLPRRRGFERTLTMRVI